MFVVVAFACLVHAFVSNDFSVPYVARNSNSHLPLFYQVAAVWGAHEGSLLLWILILSIWSVAVAAFSRGLPLTFSSRVLGVMGLISAASCCSRCGPRTLPAPAASRRRTARI